MAYLAPIHRPTSTRHALTLSFTSPTSADLLIARANRLEIWTPLPDGTYTHLATRTIYGGIALLHRLRPAKSSTDHLFVGTDRYHYFTLSWDAEKKELVTEKSFQDVAERTARDSQTGDRVAIDPTERFMALECYEGVVNVLPIAYAGKGKRKAADHEIGELGEPIPVRIPELFVKSSSFVHKRAGGKVNPELALLWEDTSAQRMKISVRELEYTPSLKPAEEPGTAELEKVKAVQGELEVGAAFLIPLPAPMYGFLVVGETRIAYVDEWEYRIDPAQVEPLDEATVFVAWCAIDEQRYALADDYGRLYLLFVEQNREGEYSGHRIDVLGETSRASTLVYLDGGRVFVGSHQGDSQIIQISEQSLEVIQRFDNVAPILDFTVMDMGNRSAEAVVNEFSSGQARIVTGSGAFKDGSLRSVRSGVGLEDLGSIGDMGAPVAAIFALKSTAGVEADDMLIVSFVSHTRVFIFSKDGEVEESDHFRGFRLDESTLHAASLPDGTAVQVTSSTVSLSSSDGMISSTWHPPSNQTITDVSAEGTTLLLSLGGAALTILSISNHTIQQTATRSFSPDEQISCITTSPSISDLCVVGFWKESRVTFLSLSDLSPTISERVAEDLSATDMAVPRSLAVANILPNQPPTLFIGLADGNVITYTLAPETLFSNRKSIILGTQQPNFALLPRDDGLENVFATCEHPSLIYGSEGRMVYSAVTAENAVSICSFNTTAYPNAIAIASDSNELKLATVDEGRTTHVNTLRMDETVRRIAYSPELRCFGLGTIKRTLRAGEELVESHFRLVDEVAFQELHCFDLGTDELVECVIRCKLDDGAGGEAERFVVGTALLDDVEEGEKVRGRILVLEVTPERRLKVVVELALRGACRCLGEVGGGRIVAGLVKTVVIYALEYQTPSTPFLTKKAVYRTATAPIDLAITPSTSSSRESIIAVADLMKSVSLLSHTIHPTTDTLIEVARHFDTLWSTAVACVAENTYLVADAEGNLVVLGHDKNGFSEDDRRRLRVTSEMLLGEMVNRIRRISITPSPNAIVVPRAFCGTVDGGVYLFGLIAPGKQDLLIQLQGRMAGLVRSPGEVKFEKFRGFRTGVRDCGEEGPLRFVDGELVERFLDLEESVQEDVVQGLPGVTGGVEEMRGVVEGLRRIH